MATDRKLLLADAAKRMQRVTASIGCSSSEAAMVHLGCLVKPALREAQGDLPKAKQMLREAFDNTVTALGAPAKSPTTGNE